MQKNWHSFDIEHIFKELKTNPAGLSLAETKKRHQKYGLNELPSAKAYSRFKIFLDQLKSPLIYILIIAGLITIFLKDYLDTIVIFGAVGINTLIGFIQENKASRALAKLKKLVKPKSVVIVTIIRS